MKGGTSQLRLLFRLHPGWYGLFAAILLTCIGVSAIHTIEPGYAVSQGKQWLPIALVVMLISIFPHPRLIGLASYPLLISTLLLLVFLLAPGVPRSVVPIRNGARAWINLHFMMLQPSELTKISFVLALAWYLRYRDSYRTLLGLLVPFIIMFIPVGLILKEPDLGTALLFAPTLFAVLIAAGAKLRHISTLLAIGFVLIAFNVSVIMFDLPQWMHVLKPHQEARIASMIWPEKYKDREAYQQTVANRLVSAGGVTGHGLERSQILIRYNALPHPHNDMIFTVITNRWGAAGGVAVVGLYLVMTSSFILVAAKTKDPFARLSCVGFAGMLFTQATINIGVNIGILPITGITLPFVSYGGSSLVATFAMIGLMLNFASRPPAIISRPSFEYDHADAIFQ